MFINERSLIKISGCVKLTISFSKHLLHFYLLVHGFLDDELYFFSFPGKQTGELERADKECSRRRNVYYLCSVQKLARLSKTVRCSGRIIRLMCGCWYNRGTSKEQRYNKSTRQIDAAAALALYASTTIVQAIKFNLFIGASFLIDRTGRLPTVFPPHSL